MNPLTLLAGAVLTFVFGLIFGDSSGSYTAASLVLFTMGFSVE